MPTRTRFFSERRRRRLTAGRRPITPQLAPCRSSAGSTATHLSDGISRREPFLLETSRRGVFAAGDVRASSVKRVASAVGEGSMAIQFVHEYLKEM